MNSRLKKVVHVKVFDFNDEMVAAKKEDPFSYKCKEEYYIGNIKIGEKKFNSYSIVKVNKKQLESLNKTVDKILEQPFSYVENDFGVEVIVKGGSTIYYFGDNREEFVEKVLKLKIEK